MINLVKHTENNSLFICSCHGSYIRLLEKIAYQ